MQVLELMPFDQVDDPICTEALIAEQLSRVSPSRFPELIYAKLPLAWLINTNGVAAVQQILLQLFEKVPPSRLVFVCQHIQVKQLDFRGATVFTPHAEVSDPYVAIPHHAVQADELATSSPKPMPERSYLASFRGAFWTHPCRQALAKHLRGNAFLIQDTGAWHFQHAQQTQQISASEYKSLLSNSKFTLCPRGTGPSSVRLWEAFAFGSIPVVIADSAELALSDILDWDSFVLRVRESELSTLADRLGALSPAELTRMQEVGQAAYQTWFRKERLSSVIIEELTRRHESTRLEYHPSEPQV